MKINEEKVLLLLSGVVVGIITAILIVNRTLNPTKFLSYKDYERNSMLLNRTKVEIKTLKKEMKILDDKLTNYSNSDNKNRTIMDSMKNELYTLKLNYGLSKVTGPGIIIKVSDLHKKKYLDENDLMFSTVHNQDLLYLVKDLKNAGAEAISINGKRIVSTSSVTCEGPVIMINGQYVVPPFVIKAIGDPDTLKYAMIAQPDSKYCDMEIRSLPSTLIKSKNIIISGVDHISTIKYSRMVEN